MISDPAKTDFKPRKRCFGDGAIINGVITSTTWILLLGDTNRAIWKIVGQWLAFNGAVLSFCLGSVLRFRFGIQNCGVLLALSAICVMLTINSIHIWRTAYPLVYWMLPALPFFYDFEQLQQWVLIEIRSTALLIWAGLVLSSSAVHIVMVYCGFGNKDMTSRGESWIYWGICKLLSRTRMRMSEFFVVVFIECSAVLAMGYYFWRIQGDITFALFCLFMAMSEISIQVKSKTAEMDRKAFLNT